MCEPQVAVASGSNADAKPTYLADVVAHYMYNKLRQLSKLVATGLKETSNSVKSAEISFVQVNSISRSKSVPSKCRLWLIVHLPPSANALHLACTNDFD